MTQAKLDLFSLNIFKAERTVVYSGKYITSLTKFSISKASESSLRFKRSFTYTTP